MYLLNTIVLLVAKLSYVLSAEPRPVFMELEKHPVMKPLHDLITPEASEQVHRYTKILQRPMAFSYFDDDSVYKVKIKRDNNEIRKLDSKRILIPKQTELIKPDDIDEHINRKKEFLIYEDYEEKMPIIVDDYDYPEDAEIEPSNNDENILGLNITESTIEPINNDKKILELNNTSTDLKSESTIVKEQPPKDTKHEKGGGKDTKSNKYDKHGAKGDKKYEDKHQEHNTEKGHHVKVADKNSHEEGGGAEKKYESKDGFSEKHHKGDNGEKGTKYEEEGNHSKGHSTKGSHNIHKKDEYEKNIDFYDEYEEDDDFEKASGFFEEDDFHKGGHVKKSHSDHGHHHDSFGKDKHYEKGQSYNDNKKHKGGAGKDLHYNHHNTHNQKIKKGGDKKWFHHKHNKPKKNK